MTELTVDLGARSYPIYIGRDLLGDNGPVASRVEGRDVLVVSNTTVAPLYLAPLQSALARSRRLETVVLPDGEAFKSLATLDQVFTALLEHRFGRDALLLALGGGVVGDMCGFAAASYQRGVDFLQMPTTLLAQVDSSVGGKTAVNHPLGKNMVGAFHQPVAVVADISTLDTLPDRELKAGLAEVVKYGLITDADFFQWLEENAERLTGRDPETLAYAVKRSCQIKAAIVADDEREAGRRALLNLGHTFGHAIETGLGYGSWLHGEAVAAGMAMAVDLSCRLGWVDQAEVARSQALLQRLDLPTSGPNTLSATQLRELMQVDKKVEAGAIRLVLLRQIGEAVLSRDFDESALLATLSECRAAH